MIPQVPLVLATLSILLAITLHWARKRARRRLLSSVQRSLCVEEYVCGAWLVLVPRTESRGSSSGGLGTDAPLAAAVGDPDGVIDIIEARGGEIFAHVGGPNLKDPRLLEELLRRMVDALLEIHVESSITCGRDMVAVVYASAAPRPGSRSTLRDVRAYLARAIGLAVAPITTGGSESVWLLRVPGVVWPALAMIAILSYAVAGAPAKRTEGAPVPITPEAGPDAAASMDVAKADSPETGQTAPRAPSNPPRGLNDADTLSSTGSGVAVVAPALRVVKRPRPRAAPKPTASVPEPQPVPSSDAGTPKGPFNAE